MLSFVVPAHNEEEFLPHSLGAIHRAASALGSDYEIIVVNDASTDRTAEIATENGARVVDVRHRQIASTRNSGARAATGDRLLFVDADTRVDQAVVGAALRALDEGYVGGSATVDFDGDLSLYARLTLPLFVKLFQTSKLAAGCFVFCTREAFEKSGGFDEEMYGGEEIEMTRSLKQLGKFTVLREPVLTSGRKLRAYSGWELYGTLFRLVLGGKDSVKRREGLEIWYEAKRNR